MGADANRDAARGAVVAIRLNIVYDMSKRKVVGSRMLKQLKVKACLGKALSVVCVDSDKISTDCGGVSKE